MHQPNRTATWAMLCHMLGPFYKIIEKKRKERFGFLKEIPANHSVTVNKRFIDYIKIIINKGINKKKKKRGKVEVASQCKGKQVSSIP